MEGTEETREIFRFFDKLQAQMESSLTYAR
jgi:hypothetical protein